LHLARIEAEGTTQSRPSRRSVRSVAQALRPASRFALAAALLTSIIGCGNNYRPVISAINPVGPAAQPEKTAVVISSNGPTVPGLITFVDFAGDTVLITTSTVGANPQYLVLNSTGTSGYTLNGDKTLTSFPITTTLLQSNLQQATLLPGANPVSIFPEGTFTYVADAGLSAISEFIVSTGTNTSALSLQQNLSINPGFTPIYTVGVAGAPRAYALSQPVGGGNGQASTIEVTSNTIDPAPIPVGVSPVYGVMTADARRAFIMNEGSNNITVINSQTNALDTPNQTITDPAAVAPLWADFAPSRNEIVVANKGNGTDQGSVSIIDIPLCSANALPTNPNCDLNNPVDGVDFGTVLANVKVGINPVMVYVLQDSTDSRAYVVNQGDLTRPCSAPSTTDPLGNCTVSVIDLTSNTVTATIPIPTNPNSVAGEVANGHPNYIAVTSGSPTGKVYVTSPESINMTVIRTDTDVVDTTVPLQGFGVSVRVTAP
jgi:YVTN family beta-propeller protein